MIALHFGLAAIASIIWLINPPVALTLHLLVFVSYFCDAAKYGHLLRWLFPRQPSQNLVVTFPAAGRLCRRIVLLAHADAAFTGWMFRPGLVRMSSEHYFWPPFRLLRRPTLVAMIGLLIISSVDLRCLTNEFIFFWTYPSYAAWSIYFAIICFMNLQVVLRNEVVPGANDNLTGCAALPVLAEWLLPDQPDNVELVCVVTGCEEAGTGGAIALERQMRTKWAREKTVMVVLDSLANGDLRIYQDTELMPVRITPWLLQTAKNIAAHDARFAGLSVFNTPAGATDALPLLVRGYPSICFGRVEPALGAPGHYHMPSDTPDNVDYGQLMVSLDFTAQFVRQLFRSANDRAYSPAMTTSSRTAAADRA